MNRQAERNGVTARVTPTGSLEVLSQFEVNRLRDSSRGGLHELFRRCALAVAPLRQARGVQNKVLEATGLGIPSVVTSAVADGLPPEIQRTCGVADTAEEFARHVVERLSLPPGERRALVADANLQALSWERQLGPLVTILAAASHRCAAL